MRSSARPWLAVCCTTATLLALTWMERAQAAEAYLYGNISNITSMPTGLLVMLDTGVPINCTGVGHGWTTIPESNKTTIAVALLAWQAERPVTVFTNTLLNGVCTVNQFDLG